MSAQKRVQKELAQCMTDTPTGMKIEPVESDIFTWHVTLAGPANTVYSGGNFGIVISLPENYPFKPPVVRFATRIYHPNVTNDSAGNICLGMLKQESWKPATKLLGVLEALRDLLAEPQLDDPLEPRIVDEYRNNRKEFDKNAKSYTARYAKGTPNFAPSADAASAPAAGSKASGS